MNFLLQFRNENKAFLSQTIMNSTTLLCYVDKNQNNVNRIKIKTPVGGDAYIIKKSGLIMQLKPENHVHCILGYKEGLVLVDFLAVKYYKI